MMPTFRSLLMVGCLLALLLGAPSLHATDVLLGDSTGGTTAHGNDGVGGIERAKRFAPKTPMTNGTGAAWIPGGSSLLPPQTPPPAPTNDLSQLPEGDLGGRLPGSTSAPRLAIDNTRQTLVVSGALPGARALVVIGGALSGASFKGGQLVPRPDVILTGLLLDDEGALTLSLEGLPEDARLAVQVWFVDSGAPAGLAATNGVGLVGQG